MIKRFVINNKIVMMRYFRLNVFVMKYSEINKIMIILEQIRIMIKYSDSNLIVIRCIEIK